MTALLRKPMIVAGVMSGTSADGIDAALVRVSPAGKLKLLGQHAVPYPKAVRQAVLRAMQPKPLPVPELARLNWRLGELYADAIAGVVAATGITPQLVGLHGQTIYHQGVAAKFLGRPTRATWQTGEASVIAERLRVPVVSDFRPADLAAGGQGAPLVPMLDYTLFRHATRNRILLNLGGIANVTVIPAGASLDGLLAFDTGPGNMVIDQLMQRLLGKKYDASGMTAARGNALAPNLLPKLIQLVHDPYFAAAPPKSCGREQFGADYAERFLKLYEGAAPEDVIASATALTVRSIRDAYARLCCPHLRERTPTDLIVSGGGVRNVSLMRELTRAFEPLKVRVMAIDDAGVPAQAKEAVAFALLAWLTWQRLPGNVPAATGAGRTAILGKVTFV
jgi:anhydro-N-acetylmuramic acid kinase